MYGFHPVYRYFYPVTTFVASPHHPKYGIYFFQSYVTYHCVHYHASEIYIVLHPHGEAYVTNDTVHYDLHNLYVLLKRTSFIRDRDDYNLNLRVKYIHYCVYRDHYSFSKNYVAAMKTQRHGSGPRLNIKTVLSMYGDFHVKDKTAVRTSYL